MSYYTAQMIVQRACVGAKNAALLIVHGGAEPVEYPITWDEAYETELWRRIDAFWHCIETLTPPFSVPPVAPPIVPVRIVDMTGDNEFAHHAAIWRENYPAKKKADTAEKELKALVEPDAAKCFGYGVTITRNRAGYLSLREAS